MTYAEANSELRSQISHYNSEAREVRGEANALERECDKFERENERMRGELQDIADTTSDNANRLIESRNRATGHLNQSTDVMRYADDIFNSVMAEQANIAVLYRGFKNVETANKKIRELTNKIYFEFANFRMVRKIVRAFIDNVSLDMVSNEMIFKSVEKEHLQSPDFWLSCAMLAIMHWREDDQRAAERAIMKAMELDERQTLLFFMSFNLLFGRKSAALAWFRLYRKMPKTGEDAPIVLLLLHAVNLRNDASDPFAKEIVEFLIEEYDKSLAMNDRDEIVLKIKEKLVNFDSEKLDFESGAMRAYLRDYKTLSTVLEMARDNKVILEVVERSNNVPKSKGYVYIEKFLSNLLDTPDKKERAYTDEIRYNELIIENVGDLAKTEEAFKAIKTYEVSPFNFMRECVDWLFGDMSAEVSDLAKSNMFILCRSFVEDSAKSYFNDYRSRYTDVHPAVIKEYSTYINFNNKPTEKRKAQEYYEDRSKKQIAAIKDTGAIVSLVFSILSILAIIPVFVFMGTDMPDLILMGLLAVVGVGLFIGFFAIRAGNAKKRKVVAARMAEALQKTQEIIDKLFAEYDKYKAYYAEKDKIAEDVIFAIRR